ncbi:hypothetical protein J7M28_05710 [bacterium]|nr:hypothetical protein [bacterium]
MMSKNALVLIFSVFLVSIAPCGVALADEWQNFTAPGWRSVENVTMAPDGSIWTHGSDCDMSGLLQGRLSGGLMSWRHRSPYNAVSIPSYIWDLHANFDGLWIASEYGLVLYKELYSVIYTSENSPLPYSQVVSVCGGADGSVWAGTRYGICRIKDDVWSSFTSQSTILPGDFGCSNMAYNDDAKVLACVILENLGGMPPEYLQCLYLYFVDSDHWVRLAPGDSEMPDGTFSYDMLFDSQGWLWMALDGDVVLFDGNDWATYSASEGSLPGPVKRLAIGPDGDIYGLVKGTSGCVCRLHDDIWGIVPVRTASPITDFTEMLFDLDGALWVFTDEGFIRISDGLQSIYSPPELGLLDAPSHTRIVPSKFSDAVWIVARGSGICRLENGEWRTWTSETSDLESPNFWDMVEAPDGALWTLAGYRPIDSSPDKFSLQRFDGATWSNFSNGVTYFDSCEARCLLIDPENNVWVGVKGGVLKFDWDVWTRVALPEGREFDVVQSVAFGDSAELPYCGGFRMLYVPEGDSWRNVAIEVNSGVSSLAIDLDGIVWGTLSETGGMQPSVFSFDGDSVTLYDTANSGILSNRAVQVAVDESNVKWFAHGAGGTIGGGVSAFDGIEWTTYTSQTSGLVQRREGKDVNICCVACAKNGVKWFGSEGYGISRLTNVGSPNPLPSLQIAMDRSLSYREGDVMTASVIETNFSSAWWEVQLVIAILLPDGSLLFFPNFTEAANILMTQSIRPGTQTGRLEFFQTTITEGFPKGQYAWFAAFSNSSGIIGHIASAPFSIE